MRRSRTRRASRALAGILALPLLAVGAALSPTVSRAQEDFEGFEIEEEGYEDEQAYLELTKFGSALELGFLYNSSDDRVFGNYNGLLNDQFYVLGNVDVRRRDLFGWGDDYHARLRGLNLGLVSRYIDAEFGRQGLFGLFFEFDQLPVFRSETAETFFGGVGSETLTLPSTWTAGANGPAMTDLEDNLRQIDIEWDRERIGGGFDLVLPWNLTFEARYDHETKEGQKLMGAVMGLNGGNPRAVVIPEPIDYVTHQIEAYLRHAGENLQLSLGYYGSGFNNENSFLQWQNPYTPVWPPPGNVWGSPTAGFNCTDGILAPATDPGCGNGRKGQMPDNWFHQILASGAYNLPYRTRVTLNTAFGWMLQDDDFLPYSVNSALTTITGGANAADLDALPRRSLDGEIFTTLVDFRVASRPLEKLNLDLGYRFDDRSNNSPQDTYVRIRGDAENQAAGQARINLPYSYTQHRVDFDAGYQIWRRTDLTLGYEWKLTDRDFQEVEQLTENTLGGILTSQPYSFLGARLSYAHAWRNGDDYVGNRPLIEGHPPGTVAPGAFENHPLLRKSYLANRERDQVKFMLTLLPAEELTVALNMNWTHEDYYASELGITDVENWGPGIDISYVPIERLSTHAFYTYQQFRSEQNGWSFTGGGAGATDPDRRWNSSDTDRTHTVGVGFDLAILPGRMNFGSDYLYAQSRGEVDVSVGAALSAGVPYPDTKSTQHNVSVHGDYWFTEHFSMRVGYLFAKFDQDDWALDGIGPTSLTCGPPGSACVIGSGRGSEGYAAHVVSWALVYTFW